MRILYLIDSLNIGGAEMLLLAMLRGYQAQHELGVAYFTHGPLYEDIRALGIPVHRLSTRGLADPRALPRALALMRAWQPQVVHTHLFKSDLIGQLAAALAGVPVRVSSIHSINPWRRKRLLSAINRQIVRRTHAFIAVTPEVSEYTQRWSGYPAHKMVVIDNGVDLHRFDPDTVTPLDKTAVWGQPPDSLLIGMIGRLQPPKGHDILLRAAAEVLAACPQARFVIIGDGPLRPQIEAQRSALGLDDQVILTGAVRDIPSALAALDVVAFPSIWEGLPVALLEAMAMRRPVAATTVGGIPDVLAGEHGGLLIPPSDPGALAAALIRLLRDAELRRTLGAQARQVVAERYSAATMQQRVLDLYQSILAQSQRSGQPQEPNL
jgi:glycosyltransferase involved in cell wall biosynthesis